MGPVPVSELSMFSTQRIFLSISELHLTIGIALPPSNVRLSNPQHVDRSFVQLNEHTIEDLTQTEQLQNFADLGADSIDTGTQMIMISVQYSTRITF